MLRVTREKQIEVLDLRDQACETAEARFTEHPAPRVRTRVRAAPDSII